MKSKKPSLDWLLSLLYVSALASIAVLGAIEKVPEEGELSSDFPSFFAFMKNNQWWFLLVAPSSAFLLRYWRDRRRELLREKNRGRFISNILNERMTQRIRRGYLKNVSNSEVDHRLTYFEPDKEQRKLRIVARSCESTSTSKTEFTLHSNNEAKCDGVVGFVYFHGCEFVVPNESLVSRGEEQPLPDLRAGLSSDSDVKEYGNRTHTSESTVREHRWRARSFAAYPVKSEGEISWNSCT